MYTGGQYSVKALQPPNMQQTVPDPTQIPGGPINTGGHDVFVVAGHSSSDVNFGYLPNEGDLGIKGTKFNDGNANGIMDPGEVETPHREKVRQLPDARQPSQDISDTGRYDALVRSARRRLSSNNQLRMDPDRVARAVEKCADCKNPPRRKVLGRDARLAAFAKAILTEAALDRVFRRMHAN